MRLVISSSNEVLFDLLYQDGQTHTNHVAQGLKITLKRWLQHGLDELVCDENSDGHLKSKTTECTDPEFLPRLKNYIERQTGFKCMLIT